MHNDYKSNPPRRHFNLVKSDVTTYTPRLRAVFCGGGGNLVVEDDAGTEATYVVSAGDTVVMTISKVKNASTTTSMVGQY